MESWEKLGLSLEASVTVHTNWLSTWISNSTTFSIKVLGWITGTAIPMYQQVLECFQRWGVGLSWSRGGKEGWAQSVWYVWKEVGIEWIIEHIVIIIEFTSSNSAVRTIYPEQMCCTNPVCSCATAGLPLKEQQCRAVVFTSGEGAQPMWSIHLYCSGDTSIICFKFYVLINPSQSVIQIITICKEWSM